MHSTQGSAEARIFVARVGFGCGLAAVASTLAYDVVQLLQVGGLLRFPLDEILIYGVSLCIVIPFVLEMLALHHLTPPDRRFWSSAAVTFTIMYAVFVTSNYVVQLATVIPAKLGGQLAEVRLLSPRVPRPGCSFSASPGRSRRRGSC